MGTRNANGRPPPPVVELGWDRWVELFTAEQYSRSWIALNRLLALNTPWSRGKDGRPDPRHLTLVVELLGPNREWLYWIPSFAELDTVVGSLALLGVAVPGGSPPEPFVVEDPAGRDEVVWNLRRNRLAVARVLRPPRGAAGPPEVHLVVEFSDPPGRDLYWRTTPPGVGFVRSALKWVYKWNLENDAGGRRWRGLDPGDGRRAAPAPWIAMW